MAFIEVTGCIREEGVYEKVSINVDRIMFVTEGDPDVDDCHSMIAITGTDLPLFCSTPYEEVMYLIGVATHVV